MTDRFVVSQLGARMHYAVPRILFRAGRLERLYTDISAVRGWPRVLAALPANLMPPALRRLRGRVPHEIPRAMIRSFDVIGMASAAARMLDPSPTADTRTALRAGRSFSRAVVRSGFGGARGFYGISGECLEQLQAARAFGLRTVVEQIIAPRRVVDALVAAEAARYPDWGSAAGSDPFAREFAAREAAEWDNADLIVCPSDFVRDAVASVGGPVARCVVVPYGLDRGFQVEPPDRPGAGRLRVLTVGALGLRKGTPCVLEAARRLRGLAEFRLVGPGALPPNALRDIPDNVTVVGVVPRTEIAHHYAWADVFLLPSVCEGSATATYEALAAGLAVVTTPNAGSVVRNGIEGFIRMAGDINGICGSLDVMARDRNGLRTMSHNALARSQEFGLDEYGSRLIGALDMTQDRPQLAA